ncbi:hypothetical protein IE81DRAFT_117046 [Ceraceosorus guamensis]|uniref:Uncharacterized protein n=1 Tax=Ceraceosorus guamensis TaxID=1522189 RepID=A0A316VYV5_9BASI|nr:hypothetical protein IE81DRAFT_117046 [Ceraceosorus guamensis]PWN42639.1 hypothetical protein IE81DRAFT_117046 [Ceraceosorus guamensis]
MTLHCCLLLHHPLAAQRRDSRLRGVPRVDKSHSVKAFVLVAFKSPHRSRPRHDSWPLQLRCLTERSTTRLSAALHLALGL